MLSRCPKPHSDAPSIVSEMERRTGVAVLWSVHTMIRSPRTPFREEDPEPWHFMSLWSRTASPLGAFLQGSSLSWSMVPTPFSLSGKGPGTTAKRAPTPAFWRHGSRLW